jgi:hypothetical protein
LQEWRVPSQRLLQVQEGLERKVLQHTQQAPEKYIKIASKVKAFSFFVETRICDNLKKLFRE